MADREDITLFAGVKVDDVKVDVSAIQNATKAIEQLNPVLDKIKASANTTLLQLDSGFKFLIPTTGRLSENLKYLRSQVGEAFETGQISNYSETLSQVQEVFARFRRGESGGYSVVGAENTVAESTKQEVADIAQATEQVDIFNTKLEDYGTESITLFEMLQMKVRSFSENVVGAFSGLSTGFASGVREVLEEIAGDATGNPQGGFFEGLRQGIRDALQEIDALKAKEAEMAQQEPIQPFNVTDMTAFTQATDAFRTGKMDVQAYQQSLVTLLQTAGLASSELRRAGMSFAPRNRDAEQLVKTLKALVQEGKLSADALKEVGIEMTDAGNKGEQSANKAKNAYHNLNGTLGSVKFALATMGVNGSSVLSKLIMLGEFLADAFRGAGSAAQSIIPILGIFLSIGMTVFGTLIKWARKLIQVIKQIGQKLVEIGTKAVSMAKSVVGKIKDKITGLIDFFKPSIKKFKKLLMQFGFGVRSPYFLIRKLRTEVIEGMKEIASNSKPIAEMMNNFKKSLNTVKGNIVSAFEPIATYVIPILTRLLNIIASVLDALAQFNAKLLGRDSYYKFVASDVNEYSDSVDGASKATKKLQHDLMGFDEINRLSDPNQNSGAGAGSSSIGQYVETSIDENSAVSSWAKRIRKAWIEGFKDENGNYVVVQSFEESMKALYEVFEDLGFHVATKINDGLLKFNYSSNHGLKEAAMKIANSLGGFINGFIERPYFGENIGKALANAFNLAWTFLHQLTYTVHWDSLGKFIGDGIASALETFNWYTMFDTIVGFFNGLSDFLYNMAVGHDWSAIGSGIAESIVGAMKKFDAVKAGQSVHEFLSALLDFINGFIEQMNTPTKVGMKMEVDPKTGKLLSGEVISEYKTGWEVLADKIRDFWDNIGAGELGEKAGSAASGGFLGFFKILAGGTSMTDAVKNFLDGFVKNINQYPWQSAMHDFWDVFYPKLKSFVGWAGPKLVELLQWLWDTISPTVIQIATDIGTAIGSAIKDAILGSIGKKILKLAGIEIDEDAMIQEAIDEDAASMEAMKQKIAGLSDSDVKTLRENWDKLSDVTKENLIKYRSEFSVMVQDTANATDQTATVIDDSTKKVQKSYNTAAESARQAGEAQNASAQVVANTSKDTANVVQNSSAKVQKSNQTSQQAFATTATEVATATGNIMTNTTNMGSVVTAGLEGIQNASDATFASIEPAAQGAYSDMVTTFDGATGYFQNLWSTVTSTFSVNGDIAKGLATGMGLIMNTSVNKMIDAINTYAIDPLIRLASAVDIIRSFSVGGIQPFAGLPKLNFFRIPKLAQGAVLPPNQPFLSIVGDQSRGTNVEAPLETIKQAVAEVMSENQDVILAVGEAIVQAINSKDTTAVISYSEIGRANNVYQNRRSTQMGY